MAIENGIYEVVSYMDSNYVMEVANDSASNRANVRLFTRNNGNTGVGSHQRAIVVGRSSSDSSQMIMFQPGAALTGNYYMSSWFCPIEVYGKTTSTGLKNGNNVTIMEQNNSITQGWYISKVPESLYGRNDLYYIGNAINSNFICDVEGANTGNYKNTHLSQNIMVMTKHSSPLSEPAQGKNQVWLFRKVFLQAKWLPVPSNVGMSTSNNASSTNRTILVSSSNPKLYPTFVCNWDEQFFVRYRYRARKSTSNSIGGWGSWQNVNGQTSDDGYGNAWGYGNVTVNNRGTRRTVREAITAPIDNSGSGNDYLEYQIEARSSEHSEISYLDKNHGSYASLPSTATVYVKWQPTLSIDSFAFTEDGIKIGYTSSFKRNNNTIKIGKLTGSKGLLTNREFTFKQLNYTGTIDIPFNELIYIPDNAENIKFTTTITSTDNASRTQNWTRPIAYNSSHGLNISAGFVLGEGATVHTDSTFKASNYVSVECHIIYKQDGETIISDCDRIGDKFVIVPPIGKSYIVMISAQNGTNWGVRSWNGMIVKTQGQMFNFGEDYFRLFLQESPYSSPNGSYSTFNTSYHFEGDRRETVYFGKGGSSTQSITGICPIDSSIQLDGAKEPYPKKCSLDDFHNMINAHYVIYRDLYGRRYDVAIMNSSEEPMDANLFNVSISMKERM